MWGRRAGALALSAVLLVPAALAQDTSATPTPETQSFRSPVLAIDQQRLFVDSAFGKASLTALETASRDLQAEIRKIESDLEIEERLLTERRQTLPPTEFTPLASAFDDKVESIRAAWGAKDRELKRQRELDQQTFYETVLPILVEVMQEVGAVMLVDQSSVILTLDRVDITQIAIERIDERLSELPPPAPSDPPKAP